MILYRCEAEDEDEKVKEEDRLIATVAEIDEQTSLVPRGAFVLEPTGHVNINRSFEGQQEYLFVAHTQYIIQNPPRGVDHPDFRSHPLT